MRNESQGKRAMTRTHSSVNPITRELSRVLVFILMLESICCYTYQVTDVQDLNGDEQILVHAYDGKYWFRSWEVDSLGQLSGSGARFSSREDALQGVHPKGFVGTIQSENWYAMESRRIDTFRTLLGVLGIGVAVYMLYAASEWAKAGSKAADWVDEHTN